MTPLGLGISQPAYRVVFPVTGTAKSYRASAAHPGTVYQPVNSAPDLMGSPGFSAVPPKGTPWDSTAVPPRGSKATVSVRPGTSCTPASTVSSALPFPKVTNPFSSVRAPFAMASSSSGQPVTSRLVRPVSLHASRERAGCPPSVRLASGVRVMTQDSGVRPLRSSAVRPVSSMPISAIFEFALRLISVRSGQSERMKRESSVNIPIPSRLSIPLVSYSLALISPASAISFSPSQPEPFLSKCAET